MLGQSTRDVEIAQMNMAVLVQQDIVRLDISMKACQKKN